MFQIIDDNGVIYSGTQEEMYEIWYGIKDGRYDDVKWTGDLKLIEVYAIFK